MELIRNRTFHYVLILFVLHLLVSSCANYKSSDGSVSSSLFQYSTVSSSKKPATGLLSKNEYIEWYSANSERLRLSIDTLDLVYSTFFRPSELEAIALAQSMDLPDSALDSLQKLKSGYSFFVFSVTPKSLNQSKKMKEAATTSYAMFDIQKDFFMVSGTDTLSCVLFMPVREKLTINGQLEYQIAFEKPKKNVEEVTIYYNDHLLGHGVKGFAFGNIIKESPQLKN